MPVETMSRRQRVRNAIEHKPVDRIPIDLGAHFSTGISVFAYYNLRKYLGLNVSHVEMIDSVQMLARVEDDILERFHVDTKLLRPRWKDPVLWNPRDAYQFWICRRLSPELQPNGDYIVRADNGKMRMPKGGFFFDGDWLQVSELDENENIAALVKEADDMRENGDYFNMYMEYGAYFGGIDEACDMYTDPDDVIEAHEAAHARNIAHFEKLLHADKKGNIDCIALNSDLGMQNAPMLRPEMYEEFCMPYVKKLCDFIHRNSDMKVFLHSCGSIEPLIPYIIEAGVDVLNPVQISAQNMDPQMLKDRYGSKICFWGGGCNTQHVLGVKTPEEVRANVKELMRVFGRDSGFVFNQVHNILGNVPPENIVAMLEAAYEFSAN